MIEGGGCMIEGGGCVIEGGGCVIEGDGCVIEGDGCIPAYYSGFSGIITENHIKLRYYGEG